jgi:hypothetical protein
MTTAGMSVLGAQPFLRGLPARQVAELSGLCRHVVVPAGLALFEEGSTADRFWLIDAGQVALEALVPGVGPVAIERRPWPVVDELAPPVAVRRRHHAAHAGVRV